MIGVEVLVDLAVMLADGGETISDLAVLRDQPQLFGEVASLATAWRTLDAIDGTRWHAIAAARAAARRQAWAAGADPGFYVIDIDATLVNCAFGEGGCGTDLQAWVRVPSVDGVSGRDRRSACRQVAARQRRVGHRRRSRRGARRRPRATARRSHRTSR